MLNLSSEKIHVKCEEINWIKNKQTKIQYDYKSILGRKPISKRCLEIGFRSSIAGTRQSIHF